MPTPGEIREIKHNLKKFTMPGLKESDTIYLRSIFDSIKQESFKITPNKLKIYLTEHGFNPNKNTLYGIYFLIDAENAKKEDYEEDDGFETFAKLCSQCDYEPHNKKKLKEYFYKMSNNKEYIDMESLRNMARSIGEQVDEQELREMLECLDPDGSGRGSFKHFCDVMSTKLYF